jgi:hypothetical protein
MCGAVDDFSVFTHLLFMSIYHIFLVREFARTKRWKIRLVLVRDILFVAPKKGVF